MKTLKVVRSNYLKILIIGIYENFTGRCPYVPKSFEIAIGGKLLDL